MMRTRRTKKREDFTYILLCAQTTDGHVRLKLKRVRATKTHTDTNKKHSTVRQVKTLIYYYWHRLCPSSFVSVSAHVAYICARLPAYVYINPFITSFLSFLAIAVVVVVGIVVSRVCTYYTCPHGSNSFLVYLIACSRLLLLLSFSIKQKKSEREKKNSSILNE